jgi:anti-anti-sigma factor
MIPGENQTTADSGAGIEIVSMPAELDLTTSEDVAAQGCAAIARLARLVLLDLTGVSFCDARGLSALVRIANHADAAGCGFGLLAPRPLVAKILRISGLDSRLPVFDHHQRRPGAPHRYSPRLGTAARSPWTARLAIPRC